VTVAALHEPRRRLGPLERLEALCDPGSIEVLRSHVVSERLGARALPGDGVIGATGMVDGRPIACYAEDGSFLGGSLGERHADTPRSCGRSPRHGFQKLTVVLRKAYGGAYITMNSRDLGADLVLALPQAELGIMSARAAVGIVNRRELRLAGDPEAEHEHLAARYAREHLRAEAVAAAGFVDELVEPADTSRRVAGALRALARAHP